MVKNQFCLDLEEAKDISCLHLPNMTMNQQPQSKHKCNFKMYGISLRIHPDKEKKGSFCRNLGVKNECSPLNVNKVLKRYSLRENKLKKSTPQ